MVYINIIIYNIDLLIVFLNLYINILLIILIIIYYNKILKIIYFNINNYYVFW